MSDSISLAFCLPLYSSYGWLRWWRICLQCRRPGFNPWVRKIPWRRHGNTLQYPCLENSMDRGAWWASVYEVANSWHNWVTEHTHTPGDLHACGLWTTLFKTILTSKPPIPCNHLDFCSISSQPTSYVFADLYSNSYRDSVQQSKADFSLKSKSVTMSELSGLLDKPLTKMHINDITLTNAEPGMGGVLCHGDSPSPLTVNYLGK